MIKRELFSQATVPVDKNKVVRWKFVQDLQRFLAAAFEFSRATCALSRFMLPTGEIPMRDLTSVELQAVSGGLMAPPPRPRHPLLRLVVAIILHLLHRQPKVMLEA
jgi:hypothetical protein